MKHLVAGTVIKRAFTVVVMAALALGFGGCVLGVTKLDVAHSPLSGEISKREGTILVRPFSDGRELAHREHIGNKRNGYGMVLGHFGANDGVQLEALLAGYFVEALQHAGYNAVLQPSVSGANDATCDVVLEGEIKEFWLDAYMKTWHNVDVKLTLKDKPGTRVLWERDIHGSMSNVLWIGVSSEFERVIREALDVAMDQAVKEFISAEFQDAVQRDIAPPLSL